MSESADEGVMSLPPFRSSRDFPISPKAENVQALYKECFQALGEANKARQILKIRMEEKRDMIISIRNEIERMECDLALEADTRIQLHALNEKLVDALREIQLTSDDFVQIVDHAQQSPRNGLRGLVEKLKAFARHWRAFKSRQRSTMSNVGPSGHYERFDK